LFFKYTMHLHQPKIIRRVELPLSKSECNRWLILNDLFPHALDIKGLSDADDTQILKRLLLQKPAVYDCGMAGTVFRFLTARLSLLPGEHIITGSPRLKERPIKPLVDALRRLGAVIDYMEKDGYAPLKITGGGLKNSVVEIDNSDSSQFATALMLIAPALPDGLTLSCRAMGVSAPYIYMTAQQLETMGVNVRIQGNQFHIQPFRAAAAARSIAPEPDWSNASYGYGLVLMGLSSEIYFPKLRRPSFQGDAVVADYFGQLGVETIYTGGGVRIRKMMRPSMPDSIRLNLSATPDIAQTLMVASAAVGVPFEFNGLHTLRIKETDRLQAMQTELLKIGVSIDIDDSHARWKGGQVLHPPTSPFSTYNDHRMAMALSMLAARFPIEISDPDVVKKSFPNFFEVYF